MTERLERRGRRAAGGSSGSALAPGATLALLLDRTLFAERWYRGFYTDVAAAIDAGEWSSAWEQFSTAGVWEGRNPNPLFDEGWYLKTNLDVEAAIAEGNFVSGWNHWLFAGFAEKRYPSPFFDPYSYLRLLGERRSEPLRRLFARARGNGSLRADFLRPVGDARDAMRHFLRFGFAQRLPPSPAFHEVLYLADNPAAASEMIAERYPSAFAHYVHSGMLTFARVRDADPPRSDDAQRAVARTLAERELRSFLAGNERISLPGSSTPRVSVIVVVHGEPALTRRCLAALQRLDRIERMERVEVEILLVDNLSTDAAAELLRRVDGARILSAGRNLGFVAGCNLAAAEARGELLLTLHSDVEMEQGLAAAVAALDADPRLGTVGGLLVSPDGALLEAGCGLLPDGSTYAFGRGGRPDALRFQCQREVPFCSAAMALTRSSLFRSLDGFDPIFSPAFLADADYALRAARRGWRTAVVPQWIGHHFEHAGYPLGYRRDALVQRNQIQFRARHGPLLEALPASLQQEPSKRPPPPLRRLPLVVFIDDWPPFSRLGSGAPRSAMIARQLAERDPLIYLWNYPADTNVEELYADFPRSTEWLPAHELEEILADRAGRLRLLWVERPHNMERVVHLRRRRPELFYNVPIVYGAEALFTARDRSYASLAGRDGNAGRWQRQVREEITIAGSADAIVTVNAAEAAAFGTLGKPTFVVSYGVACANGQTPGFDDRRGLLFVGAIHQRQMEPNLDALEWFAREVLPLVREQEAEITLRVAGYWGPGIRPLTAPGVELLGALSDLTPLYDSARLFVAPTRFAAGIPIKVIDAAARGIPTCVTDLLASQLGWTRETCSSPAEPKRFAERLLTLYRDREQWESTRRAAADAVRETFSPEALRQSVRRVLAALDLA